MKRNIVLTTLAVIVVAVSVGWYYIFSLASPWGSSKEDTSTERRDTEQGVEKVTANESSVKIESKEKSFLANRAFGYCSTTNFEGGPTGISEVKMSSARGLISVRGVAGQLGEIVSYYPEAIGYFIIGCGNPSKTLSDQCRELRDIPDWELICNNDVSPRYVNEKYEYTDETADFYIYKNELYGYTLKFPRNLIPQNDSYGDSEPLPQATHVYFQAPNMHYDRFEIEALTAEQNPSSVSLPLGEYVNVLRSINIYNEVSEGSITTVGGKMALSFTTNGGFKTYTNDNPGLGWSASVVRKPHTFMFVKNENQVFRIWFPTGMAEAEYILQNFSFIK